MTDVRTEVIAQRRRVSLLRLAASILVRVPDRMVFGVGVCGVGGDDVADPAERAARANPEARRDD